MKNPKNKNPQNKKPQSKKAQSKKPQINKPQINKPQINKPQSNKPQSNRPMSEKSINKDSLRKYLKIAAYCIVGLLALFMIVVVGGFIFLSTTDINRYQQQITDRISEQLGREVVIDGDFSAEFSWTPSLKLSKVHVANTHWGQSEKALQIEEFAVSVNLLKLLIGHVEIKQLHIKDAFISIEKKGNLSNWQAEQGQAYSPSTVTSTLVSTSTNHDYSHDHALTGFDFSDLPLILNSTIDNVTLQFVNHDNALTRSVHINSITTDSRDDAIKSKILISDIASNGKSLGELTATIDINADGLFIRSLKQGNALDGKLAYTSNGQFNAQLTLKDFETQIISTLIGGDNKIKGKLNGKINLKAKGKNKSALLKKLNGNINITSNSITLNKNNSITQWLENIVPLSQIQGCLLINAPVNNGTINLDSAVAVTNQGSFNAQGNINLPKQSIKIPAHIHFKPKGDSINAKAKINITGKINNPKIDIDKNSTPSLSINIKKLSETINQTLNPTDEKQNSNKIINLKTCQEFNTNNS